MGQNGYCYCYCRGYWLIAAQLFAVALPGSACIFPLIHSDSKAVANISGNFRKLAKSSKNILEKSVLVFLAKW